MPGYVDVHGENLERVSIILERVRAIADMEIDAI
jgi:hypothetical protein